MPSALPVAVGADCRTTHYACRCVMEQLERAEAEAALMRVALQSLRRRIDDIIQAATKEHEDLYWLDDGVTQIVKADADAALASDAGRALLERVRKLERAADRLLELLYHGHATLTEDADAAAQELRAALRGENRG